MALTIMRCDEGRDDGTVMSVYLKGKDVVAVQRELLANGLTLSDASSDWGVVTPVEPTP